MASEQSVCFSRVWELTHRPHVGHGHHVAHMQVLISSQHARSADSLMTGCHQPGVARVC